MAQRRKAGNAPNTVGVQAHPHHTGVGHGLGNSLLEKEPDLADKLIDTLAEGLFDAQVAEKHGINKKTLWRWLDLGMAEDAREPFKTFTERYLARMAEIESKAVKSIRDAGEPAVDAAAARLRGDWKATAWWLERWRPLRWGTRVHDPGVRDTWQQPQPMNRAKRAEDVFRNPTPDLLRAIDSAGKMLVEKTPVVETTGTETKPGQSSK